MNKHRDAYVVDADPSSRTGLHRLLITADFNAKAYASVIEMVHKLKSGISGVLILDLRSLSMTGKELVEQLQARGIRIPIIAISCDEDESVCRRNAKEMNAVALFRKPVDGMALIDAVEWAINGGNNVKRSTKANNN